MTRPTRAIWLVVSLGCWWSCAGCHLASYSTCDSCSDAVVLPAADRRTPAQLAESTWLRVSTSSTTRAYSADYAHGFRLGFQDYLRHGRGQTPAELVGRYRRPQYLTAAEVRSIDEYFAGLKHGAMLANDAVQRQVAAFVDPPTLSARAANPAASPDQAGPRVEAQPVSRSMSQEFGNRPAELPTVAPANPGGLAPQGLKKPQAPPLVDLLPSEKPRGPGSSHLPQASGPVAQARPASTPWPLRSAGDDAARSDASLVSEPGPTRNRSLRAEFRAIRQCKLLPAVLIAAAKREGHFADAGIVEAAAAPAAAVPTAEAMQVAQQASVEDADRTAEQSEPQGLPLKRSAEGTAQVQSNPLVPPPIPPSVAEPEGREPKLEEKSAPVLPPAGDLPARPRDATPVEPEPGFEPKLAEPAVVQPNLAPNFEPMAEQKPEQPGIVPPIPEPKVADPGPLVPALPEPATTQPALAEPKLELPPLPEMRKDHSSPAPSGLAPIARPDETPAMPPVTSNILPTSGTAVWVEEVFESVGGTAWVEEELEPAPGASVWIEEEFETAPPAAAPPAAPPAALPAAPIPLLPPSGAKDGWTPVTGTRVEQAPALPAAASITPTSVQRNLAAPASPVRSAPRPYGLPVPTTARRPAGLVFPQYVPARPQFPAHARGPMSHVVTEIPEPRPAPTSTRAPTPAQRMPGSPVGEGFVIEVN